MLTIFTLNSRALAKSSLSRVYMSSKASAGSCDTMAKLSVLVPIANGSEEIESVTIIDTLVRGGAAVTVASVESTLQVVCSRGVKLSADTFIDSCIDKQWDLIALPGKVKFVIYNVRSSSYLQEECLGLKG